MKWLVTAFEPFAGGKTNSSLILAERLSAEPEWQRPLHFHFPLPVRFDGAWPALQGALADLSDVAGVLALGQAETRSRISLERVALNWIDARVADNSGKKVSPRPVTVGPDMYWGNIPWSDFKYPDTCELSYSAGTFVCNALFYQLMQWARLDQKFAGFVHIPLLTSQSDISVATAMDDEVALAALRKILHFVISR